MKKLLLLAVLFTSVFFMPMRSMGQCNNGSYSCSVFIEGSSNFWLEGWAGYYIEVWQDTTLRGTFTLEYGETHRVENIDICSGDSVRFVWRADSTAVTTSFNAIHISIFDANYDTLMYDVSPVDFVLGETFMTMSGQCPACPVPSGFNATVGTNTIDLSWTEWGNEIKWIVNIDTAAYQSYMPSITFNNLERNQTYDISVRAICYSGDTTEAFHRSYKTLELTPVDQWPYFVNFETSGDDTNWFIFNGDMGPNHQKYPDNWVINAIPSDTTGHGVALYITDDIINKPYHHNINTSLPASFPYAYTLLYLTRGEYNYGYDWKANSTANNGLRVSLVPYENGIEGDDDFYTSFIPLDGGAFLTGETQWQNYNGYFTIRKSGLYGMVFQWASLNDITQPPAAVDNISVSQASCATPVDLTLVDSAAESLTISWEPIGEETSWLVDYGQGYVLVNDTVYTITGLTRNTTYNVTVRALCGIGDTSRSLCGAFTTLPIDPDEVLPLYCDFEDSVTNTLWMMLNGTQRNKWYIGEAANNTTGGMNGLYISGDEGATNTNVGYYNGVSTVMTYVMFTLTQGIYEYGYDWRCMHGGNWDVLHVALVPASTDLQPGDEGVWHGYPQGAISLDDSTNLINSSEWVHQSGSLNINNPGIYKMVFYWRNDGGAPAQPPAAIDNVFFRLANCFCPDNLAVEVDSTSLTFSWHPVGQEHLWKVMCDDNAIFTTDTFHTFQNLIPNREYRLKVYSVCGQGDTSVYAYVDAATTCGTYTTMPFVESFDDSRWLNCWDTLDFRPDGYSGSTILSWWPSDGLVRSYCSGHVSEDSWLITPPVRLQSSTGHNLRFTTLGFPYLDDPAHMTVLLSTSNSRDTADYTDTLISVYIPWANVEYSVDLSQYNGQTVRIAFIHDSPSSYIDLFDVAIEERETCPQPLYLSVLRGMNTMELSWIPDGEETQWEVSDGTNRYITNTPSYTFQSLAAATTYEFSVRAICGEGDTSRPSFYTATTLLHEPALPPYYCDFSNQEAYNWCMIGDTISNNCWYVGSATYYGNSNNVSIYVSNDSGAHNQATERGFYYVSAYRTFNLSAGEYNCGFYWKNECPDRHHLSAFLLPADNELRVGRDPIYNGIWPMGSICLEEYMGYQPTWQYCYHEFTVPEDGQYNLVFLWRRDISGAQNPTSPAPAVDNVSLQLNTCPQIEHFSAVGVAPHAINLDWNYTLASEWEIEYGPIGFDIGTGTNVIVSSHPYTITDLDSATTYDIYIRPICTVGDSGVWKKLTERTGFCDYATLTHIGQLDVNNSQTQLLASTNNYTFTEIIIKSDELYPGMTISGMQIYYDGAMALTNDTAVDIYLQPTNVNDLFEIMAFPDINTAVHVFHGSFEDFTTGWNTIVFDNEYTYYGPGNMLLVAKNSSQAALGSARFRGTRCPNYEYLSFQGKLANDFDVFNLDWYQMYEYNTYNYRPLITFISCVDVHCMMPDNLEVADKGYDYANITWEGSATSYRVSVRAADSTSWRPEQTVTTNSAVISGLHSARTYMVLVRSVCELGMVSPGASIYFSTDTLPCQTPANLHSTDIKVNEATFDWTPTGDEEMWMVHLWNSAVDETYYTDHHPYTIQGLSPNMNYNCEVQAICGDGAAESEPSDRVVFQTLACPEVTGVEVTNVKATKADISWNQCSNSYQVEYGKGDFAQGSGTRMNVTDAESCTLIGLEPGITYSVNVRSKCDNGGYGAWSPRVQFTTSETGIDEYEILNSQLSIYPNPSDGDVTIAIPQMSADITITIADIKGHICHTAILTEERTTMHLNLPAGIYFLRADIGNSYIVKKLVVM